MCDDFLFDLIAHIKKKVFKVGLTSLVSSDIDMESIFRYGSKVRFTTVQF